MMVNSTTPAPAPLGADEGIVAKPLNELSSKERKKVTSELQRIHSLVSRVADVPEQDKAQDKAERF